MGVDQKVRKEENMRMKKPERSLKGGGTEEVKSRRKQINSGWGMEPSRRAHAQANKIHLDKRGQRGVGRQFHRHRWKKEEIKKKITKSFRRMCKSRIV